MPVLRFSACRDGAIGDQIVPWHLFGETVPDTLEGDARNGVRLDQLYRQAHDRPFAKQPVFRESSLLAAHLAALDDTDLGNPDAPVVVFVHGFQFEARRALKSRRDSDNPHRRLFHFEEVGTTPADEHALHLSPWLTRTFMDDGMGVMVGRPAPEIDGLAVCFGYSSFGDTNSDETPGLFDFLDSIVDFSNPQGRPQNFYALAYIDAMIAGHGLAAVLVHLVRRLQAAGQAGRPIDIVCHSLGTRTALKALEVVSWRYPEDRAIEHVGRVLLLAGACLWEQAGQALKRIEEADAEGGPEFYNILSRADEVVRVLGARASLRVARAEAGREATDVEKARALLHGAALIGRDGRPPASFGGGGYRDWVDIDLDDSAVQDWGRTCGFDLDGDRPFLEGDHWVHFTHRPNWDLYRNILRRVPGYDTASLRTTVPAI